MHIDAGTKIGPYVVEQLLGVGGMGAVYRARDTRLDRGVALKVLRQDGPGEGQASARIAREARAIASLNHPNICAVYDVGESDGRDYLVMELLEGETLQQRLARGFLDVRELLRYALALADALSAAHARGLIHRDLKPANIFILATGALKVLDFGIARRLVGPGDTTQLQDATGQGGIAGTIAYMSPEQLRGEPVDARSDVFSLGAVLYEMLTGRPAFGGGTAAVVAGQVLHAPPRPPVQIRADSPPGVQQVVVKALEKDPAARYQSAAELRADLEEQQRLLDSATHAEGNLHSRLAEPVAPARWPAVTAALGVLAAGVAAAYWLTRDSGGESVPPPVSFDQMRITQLTSTGDAERPAISADGKFVAFVRREGRTSSLWVRQISTTSSVQIAAADEDAPIHGATITADGEFVDFLRGPRRAPALWRVPLLGGGERKILERVNSLVCWSPDGRAMAFLRDTDPSTTALVVADRDGRNERVITTRRQPAQFTTTSHPLPTVRPDWSPDGELIALAGFDVPAGPTVAQVVVVRVKDGSQHAISMPGAVAGLAWLGPAELAVNYRGQFGAPLQLWRVPFPQGRHSRLTNDLLQYQGLSVTSARTAMATTRIESDVAYWLGDGKSYAGSDAAAGAFSGQVETMSWAGERLLYSGSLMGEAAIRTAATGRTAGVTIPDARAPAASADGRIIVFVSTRTGTAFGPIYKADPDGSNQVQLVDNGSSPVVTPDGSQVVFVGTPDGVQSLWMVPTQGGTPQRLTRELAGRPTISSDGRRLAFLSRDGMTPIVVVCDLPSCGAATRIPLATPLLKWMPGSTALAYVPADRRTELWAHPLDGGKPRLLMRFADGKLIEDAAWSSDGKRLAIMRASSSYDIVLIRAEAAPAEGSGK
jgi:Tol biopolymer transport system component/predicted Ser/Thr protein kinase